MRKLVSKKETIADRVLVYIAESKLTTLYETSEELKERKGSVLKAVRSLEKLGLVGRLKTRFENGHAVIPLYATSQGWFQAALLSEVKEYEPRPGPWFLYHSVESNEGLLG